MSTRSSPSSEFQRGLDLLVLKSIRPAAMAIMVLYLVFIGLYQALLPPDAVIPMTILGSVTVGLSGSLYAWLLRRTPSAGWAHPLGGVLVLLVLINLTAHFALAPRPDLSANLAIVIVATGCFFLSYLWLTGSILACLALWSWGAFVRLPDPNWMFFLYMLVAAVVTSVLVHEVRRRSFVEFLRAEKELRFRTEFERMLTEISTQFLSVAPEDVDTAVQAAMDKVRNFVEVDMVYVVRIVGESPTISIVHECCGPGVEPRRDRIQGISVSRFPWFWDRISRGEAVSIPEVRELSDEAAACREFLLAGKVRSFLAVPLASEQALWGYLGFVTTSRPAQWSDDAVKLFRVLGEIFLVSLQRKTEREEVEALNAKLRHASRLVLCGESAGAVYHQIRNIFMSTAMLAGAARRSTKLDRIAAMMRDIEQNVLESSELLQEFLEFTRTGESQREQLAPDAVVDCARKLASLVAKDYKVELHCEISPELRELHCSKILVVQVFANLIFNAINALKEVNDRPRQVTVRVEPGQPGFVEATIADNGPGVPSELEQAVFERFFTTRPDGIGLGLYISKSIVESHGGRLWLNSVPGQGAEFRFTLPINQSEPD